MTKWASNMNSLRKKIVKEIFMTAQNGKCFYCNVDLVEDKILVTKNPRNLSLDHIHPLAAGGKKNEFRNLVACCSSCNVMKADKVFECDSVNLNRLNKIHDYVETTFFDLISPNCEEYITKYGLKKYKMSCNFSWSFVTKKAKKFKAKRIRETRSGYELLFY